MRYGIGAIGRALSGLLPGARLMRGIERARHGGRAVYLGGNRLLVKIAVGRRDFAFYVEADDKLITPWFVVSGKYEVDTTHYLERTLRPGAHCIDVGANFGYFTVLMARLCPGGRVIGIEPERRLVELARDNLRINDLHEVGEIRHGAAGDRAEAVTLFRRTLRAGNTSMIDVDPAFTSLLGEPPVEPFQAPGLRIDDLLDALAGRVDCIKIDVEGAEPLVLAGARGAIAANPGLRIIVEWSPVQMRAAGFEIAAVLRDIVAMGLRPFRLTKARPAALSFAELEGLSYQAGVLLMR